MAGEAIPASPASSASRVLIIKPSSLGDVIQTLPAVAALSAARPEWQLWWLANTEWVPLLEGHPALKSPVAFPRKDFRGWSAWFKARRWARENLRPLEPDLALDFQGLFRSAWLGRVAGARELVGFERTREWAGRFYDRRIPVEDWDDLHAVDRYLRLVEAVTGVETPAELRRRFDLPEGEAVDGFPAGEREAIVLHPYARGQGKSFSSEEVTRFCVAVAPQPVIIVGGEAPGGVSESALPSNAHSLLGRTNLSQLIWVLRKAAWVVSVDSGPMHLAAALGPRILSIHTWSDPRLVGPCRPDAWVWRAGQFCQQSEVVPEQFPERRHAKRGYSTTRLLGPGDIDRIAAFALSQIGSGFVEKREDSQP